MSKDNLTDGSDQNEYSDICAAAGSLTNYACALSSRHLEDGTLRAQFNREVSVYMQSVIESFDAGIKSFKQSMREIQKEQRRLLNESKTITRQIFSAYVGGVQVYMGVSSLRGGPIGAVYGSLLTAHGVNNIYENVANLKDGRSDALGPVREFYQEVAISRGRSKADGNLAYGAVDIGVSGYGLLRLVKNKDARRLFRYVREDFRRGFENASKTSIGVDILSTGYTLDTMSDDMKSLPTK